MDYNRKLNIAMVCDAVTDCLAGSFVSTLRFAELLSEQGHKVIFIAAKSPKSPCSNNHKNIRIYRFASVLLPKSEKQYYLAFPTAKEVKKILQEEKIDILHVLIPTPAGIVSMKAVKELGIKVVVHSHTQPENIFLHLPKMFFVSFLNDIFYKYLVWAYNKADAIIYPTEFAKRLMKNLKPGIKSVVISNGVDTVRFKKADMKDFVARFGLDEKKKKLLYVGRLHPEKCVDTLIKSVRYIRNEFPDFQVMIVGFGHLDMKLKELAKKLGADKDVMFLGRVSDEDLPLAFNAADIFVLPSLAELEGMVVLEAMAAGKPLVIADAKNSASIDFVKGNGFLFRPEDEKDLAAQILKLLKNEPLLLEMGEESLRQSRNYDIHECAKKLENLYYSIL